MVSGVHLRVFRFPADFAAVRHVWDGNEKGVRAGASDETAEIEKKLERDPELFLVAGKDREIIGQAIGGFDGLRGLISHLAVSAPLTGRGVRERLMDEVESRLRARGCRKCYLLVTPDYPDAMTYWSRRDWRPMDYVRLFGKELA